jgi:hypothetical protein
VSEDPLSYVYHQLSYLSSTNPVATEGDKVSRLFDGLPAYLKSNFIENPPQTVQAFTDRLKDFQRKQAYNQKALIENALRMSASSSSNQITTNVGGSENFNIPSNNIGITQQSLMAALANLAINPTSSMPHNLISNLAAMNISQSPQSLGLSIKPAMVQSYVNLPTTSLAHHVTQIVMEANQESEISKMKEQIAQLTKQQHQPMQARQPYGYQQGQNGNRAYQNRKNAPDGRPICLICDKAGHIARFCRSGSHIQTQRNTFDYRQQGQPHPSTTRTDRYTAVMAANPTPQQAINVSQPINQQITHYQTAQHTNQPSASNLNPITSATGTQHALPQYYVTPPAPLRPFNLPVQYAPVYNNMATRDNAGTSYPTKN